MKISHLRNYGTEQATMSVDLPDNASTEEVRGAFEKIDGAVFHSVQLTNERQIKELTYFAEVRERGKAAEAKHKAAFGTKK